MAVSARVLVAVAALAVSPAALAQPSVGEGRGGLPGVDRVGLVARDAPLASAAMAVEYGFTEAVLDDADRHHRLGGTLAAAVSPTPWLGLSLAAHGRVDVHSGASAGSDRGALAEPVATARVGGTLGEAAGLAGELAIWIPAGDDSGRALAGTSIDARALATLVTGPVHLGALVGFRYDRSGESIEDPDRLSRADRLALGVSDASAVLLGVAASVRVGETEILAELTWDALVGADAPSIGRSPLRLGAGVRRRVGDRVALVALLGASASARPDVDVGQGLVVVEPRVFVRAGLSYRFEAASPTRVYGHVVDEEGAPIGGARVTLGELEAETDADGAFRFEEPAPGPTVLRAVAPGYVAGEAPVEVVAEATVADARVVLTAEAPPAIGVVRGRVITRGGLAIADAEVTMGERRARSDDGGAFVFEAVPVGRVEVRAAAPDRVPAAEGVEVVLARTVEVELVLDPVLPLGEIRGTVSDFRTQGVPPGAVVLVTPGDARAGVDADGVFRVEVPPGRYSVEVTAEGYHPSRQRAEVEDNGVTVLVFDLRQAR